jgi:myo-inositol-1(or 4)-monophosphatase
VSPTPTDLLALALTTAREAGALAASMREGGIDVAETKSSPTDIVTRADRACEELVRERLLGARPDDGFLGEEGGDQEGTSGVRWIVDPIDGTVNYLYGLPHWAVSIAASVDGRVVAGAVVAPALDTEYAATAGGGATRDGVLLGRRSSPSLSQSLVATGFSYEREIRAHQAGAVARMLPQVRDIRRLGSCALDLCSLATGAVDAYVEEGPHLWDHAAGGLVAAECDVRLEVWPTPRGMELLVCAPVDGWPALSALVSASGFLREEDAETAGAAVSPCGRPSA